MVSNKHGHHNAEHIDSVTGVSVTGHEWDGIQELNNPLPRWWINIFYACIIWSIGYFVVYPAWPTIDSYSKGIWEYSSRQQLVKEVEDLRIFRKEQASGLETSDITSILADKKLYTLALAHGKAAFGDNCAPCHGVGASGGKGYPSLLDDDWLWGGTTSDILTTITHGIRSDKDDKTRISSMASFGRDGTLKKSEIYEVANYVRSLSGSPVEKDASLKIGAKTFADNCVACHSVDGKGNKEFGAPNLTDSITLYGDSLPDIIETITNGRNGVMPNWGARLDAETIKSLVVYVNSLSGGH